MNTEIHTKDTVIVWENLSYKETLDRFKNLIDDYHKEQQQQFNITLVNNKKAAKAKRQELKAISKLPKTKLSRKYERLHSNN